MLILTRKTGEAVRIGNVRIVINRVGRGAVRIGIDAPREVPIVREELDEDSGGGTGIDPAPKPDPEPDFRPVASLPSATSTGSTSRPHRTAQSRRGLPAGPPRNTSKKTAGVDRFQLLQRARRRGPDSGSMARLNPGFHC